MNKILSKLIFSSYFTEKYQFFTSCHNKNNFIIIRSQIFRSIKETGNIYKQIRQYFRVTYMIVFRNFGANGNERFCTDDSIKEKIFDAEHLLNHLTNSVIHDLHTIKAKTCTIITVLHKITYQSSLV